MRTSEAREGRGGRGANCAQTFRRGRAVAFLERLQGMRDTLAKQLNEPEFESIRPVISGELKAVDHVIQMFAQTFELRGESDSGHLEANGKIPRLNPSNEGAVEPR